MERIKLIALDMDGTLLLSDHSTVPERNILAIQAAHRHGIHVCICTGRMLEDASEFCRRLDLPCKVIACNGTRAADGILPNAHVFLKHQFEPKDAQAALDILFSTDVMVNVFEDGLVSTRMGPLNEPYHLVKRGVLPAEYGEEAVRKAADRGVMKIFAICTDEQTHLRAELMERIRKKLPHLMITSSGPRNIEIMPPHAGKGTALRAMAEYFGLSREQVMAVGDADNDLSMLKFALHSVAMGNASDDIKAACRYITASNDDCGVAQIIEQVLEVK